MYFEWVRSRPEGLRGRLYRSEWACTRQDGAGHCAQKVPGGGGNNSRQRIPGQMGQGICMRAGARAEGEDGDRDSCGAPASLGWRAEQELRSGEPFNDMHISAANRAGPE